MLIIFLLIIMILLIIFILIIMLNLISKKSFSDREKSSPFECGFDSKNSARLPFSLQFFLIAVIFLIFDVEITLLFPLIITLKISNMNYSIIFIFFIMILIFGLFHEWNQGALNWAY
ncbi:NADH dehydrogenase subunit 3 (mitochondrion) [Anoplophora glabripennis]|uniref:NADH-ubiquinone oxidoreductase chain 3 n=1 Tax=Anoplophora glabripennis TaxID=217634 RepID=Q14V49_ANOGL|nr:NADH dehydrogenase subunit 3 [Anoplophora glabripennis]ABG29174.1 NADH dehydrogenase subunit 3 [Anoplophora glabripennis]